MGAFFCGSCACSQVATIRNDTILGEVVQKSTYKACWIVTIDGSYKDQFAPQLHGLGAEYGF